MSDISEKGKTNRKWTSNQQYRDNYERIFRNEAETETKTRVQIGGIVRPTQEGLDLLRAISNKTYEILDVIEWENSAGYLIYLVNNSGGICGYHPYWFVASVTDVA
jgi:hypothetical protein